MNALAPSVLRGRKYTLGLVALLGTTMVTATYLQGALSVLSSFLIDEFGVSRSQLGAAFTAYSLTGAAASPLMGTLTDRGTGRVMAALFGLTGTAVLLVAVSPSYAVLLVGCVVGGLSLGAGNPVTNRVVAERISRTHRGLVVGLKQAGPPLGLLVAGLLLPPLAIAVGWRWALAASIVIPATGLAATPYLLSRTRVISVPEADRTAEETLEAKSVVLWLTVIGLGMAVSLSAVIAFLPLFAQERVGVSAATAGTLAAVMGLSGAVWRIVWGAVGGRFSRPSTALLIMSAISVLTAGSLMVAETAGVWALWVGVLGVGASMLAWHAVAWLVIIDRVGIGGVGKASGVMQLGNGIGMASGPPLVGVIVDVTDSYTLAWGVVAGVLTLAGALTFWVRIRSRRRERP